MLKVEMTPNLLGFKVSGDYDDLNELYDAVWDLALANEDCPNDARLKGNPDEQLMSERLLAFNYDIRHAYQGSRGIELEPSGMNTWDAEYRDMPFVENNVFFSVEILYPEAMYEALVLNYLIQKRRCALVGQDTYDLFVEDTEKTLLDKPICVTRAYLSKLLEAVEQRASAGRFQRIRKELADNFHSIPWIYQQWIDVLNSDYATMTPKQRAESLSTIVRDLAQARRHEQYVELTGDIDRCAAQHNTSRNDVRIPGLYEWDEPEW